MTAVDSRIVTFDKEKRCYGEESRRPVFSAVTNETKSSAVAKKVRDAPRYLQRRRHWEDEGGPAPLNKIWPPWPEGWPVIINVLQ